MKEFEAKVRLNEENGGKTGELDIISPPPFDKGYFNGVTYGITFKDPVFEAGKSEWIPCSERLPDNHDTVAVWCEWIDDEGYSCGEYNVASCYNGHWYGKCLRYKVIAWMPLPEPYKQEDEHGS